MATAACAIRRAPAPAMAAASSAVVVPNQCIEEIRKGPHTYCRGESLERLSCYRMLLTRKKGCEQLEVTTKPEHKPITFISPHQAPLDDGPTWLTTPVYDCTTSDSHCWVRLTWAA
jgi:hypothetical protein